MKIDLHTQEDLIKLGAMIGDFARLHVTDNSLKAYMTVQSEMTPYMKAFKSDDSNNGLTAKDVYGQHVPKSQSFAEHSKRQGAIFIANNVGQFSKENNSSKSLEFLSNAITSMSIQDKEHYSAFISQLSAIKQKLPDNFASAVKLQSLLDEKPNQIAEKALTR
jgi:hypothetical protein